MAIGTALSVGLVGLRAFVITMQAYICQGLPRFSIIGLPDTSLSEARERVRSACTAAGVRWPVTRVTVNLSPASLPKSGSGHDLAIAASILCANGTVPETAFDNTLVMGELKLDGMVLPVPGMLPVLLHARNQGIHHAYIPAANLDEARLVSGITTTPIRHLGELIERLGGRPRFRVTPPTPSPMDTETPTGRNVPDMPLDMNQVIGQEQAKRALCTAAAGGHHLLMVGPPGSGKTMLASRLPSILPPLDERRRLEVASIRSICGTLPRYGITDVPPYEAPHHTASVAAMVGGGSGVARPGAVTQAHNGVLFMDEAPEFAPRVLQTIREPLETGQVLIARSKASVAYPARFQLVMAANPCPCGHAWDAADECRCTPRERIRYWNRLSGPILDRIDIQIAVPQVATYAVQNRHGDVTSARMRTRVSQARSAAVERFRGYGWGCNAEASGTWLRDHTSRKALNIVAKALDAHRLSPRGADRALRLAWTLADLDGAESPNAEHTAIGIAMRTRLHQAQ